MNRTIVFFLMLCTCLFANAQEVIVKEFKELSQDLAARTNEKLDANGNSCALVKVVIPKQDVQFEGWVIDQQYTPGEYWVYLPEGAPKLKIKHSDLTPLVYEFPENLLGKHTYQMILEVQEVQKHFAFFQVKGNIDDFILYIGSEKFVSKKGNLEVKLPNGTYDYTLAAKEDSYNQVTGSVTITDKDSYKKINCKFTYTNEYLAAKEHKKEKRKKVWSTIGAVGIGAAAVVGSQVLKSNKSQ